jgi:hypothetical protein
MIRKDQGIFCNREILKVLKSIIMGNLLYVIVIILITAWSIVFIGYGIGGIIHMLPVLAILMVIIRFRLDKRVIRNIN